MFLCKRLISLRLTLSRRVCLPLTVPHGPPACRRSIAGPIQDRLCSFPREETPVSRTMVTSLALTTAAGVVLGACAGETPATSFSAALSAPPVASPSPVQETREAREAYIIKALTPSLPPGVQGM